jgi:membrane-associated phospholipid phosphatase
MKDIQRMTAEAISSILNAPLVTLYAFAILIFVLNPPSALLLFAVSAFFGSFLPILIVFSMMKTGVIPDFFASVRRTRTKPFVGVITSYLIGLVALALLHAPRSLVALMACYIVNSLVMLAITQFWKISIHASGVAGPATFLIHQHGAYMLPFLALLLPVGWARIKLKAHSVNQVAAGALLTIILTLVQAEFYLQ